MKSSGLGPGLCPSAQLDGEGLGYLSGLCDLNLRLSSSWAFSR